MEERKSQPFRVLNLRFGLDAAGDEVFASSVEQRLNELSAEGYSVQLIPTPTGILVLAHMQWSRQLPETLSSLILRELSAEKEPTLDPRVQTLIEGIVAKAGTSSYAGMEVALPQVLPSVLKDFPFQVIFDVAKECEDYAQKHDGSDHAGGPPCIFSSFLKVLAEQMRGFAKQQVQ